MKKFSYIKINGAGNDFVLIDEKINKNLEITPTDVTRICDRINGIGADGLIIIKDDEETHFEMKYYNADGSTGSLCGNGARCAIKYAQLSDRIEGNTVHFFSNKIEYSGEIINDKVIKFYLQPVSEIKINFKLKAFGQLINSYFVDTGSPHVIININDILINPKNPQAVFEDIHLVPVDKIGREIRNLPEFKPNGTNINFIDINEAHIKIRSFERGVEAETLACGTGSVAAAIIAKLVYKKNAPIKLITKSNAELIVNFEMGNNEIVNVSLTGPVEIEKEGQYSI